MVKKDTTDRITIEASINEVKLKRKEHRLSFSALKLGKGRSDFITELIENESLLEVSIAYQGKADPNFPPITCQCGLKGFGIKKTMDKPEFVNMKFSGEQVDKLMNIMDSEAEIDLTITRKQGTFNFKDRDLEPED